MNDLRFAVRTLCKSRGFTAIAVLTLALGIGANTAVFSLVHAVILKPLPYRDPSRLVSIWDSYAPQVDRAGLSPVELANWQRQTDLFSESAWYRSATTTLALNGGARPAMPVTVTFISSNLLSLLGAHPAIGRGLRDDDSPNTALVSDRVWRTGLGADPTIVGKSIRMSGGEYLVAGVMPREFAFPDWADVWLPKGPQQGDELTNPVRHALGVVARLRPGVSLEAALARAKPGPRWTTHAAWLQDDVTSKIRPALLMLMGAVTLVLLIACANVANLLLSRAAGRAREIAVRIALGAGAGRLIRQLIAESLTLSVTGAALGLALAETSLRTFSPVPAPLDGAVLSFLTGVSLLTGVVFGLVPASQILSASPAAVIRSNSAASGGSPRLRAALVVTEFALALILAAGAAILMRSFARMMHAETGFDAKGVLTMRVSLPPGRDPAPFFRRAEALLKTLPGVDSVAASNSLPPEGDRAIVSRFLVPGSTLTRIDAPGAAQVVLATADLFRALRIPIRSGRAFTDRDADADSVIVSETMARRFWPGRDPVGLKFVTSIFATPPGYSTIVGVAADVKRFGLDGEATADIYWPVRGAQFVFVRGSGNVAALGPAARTAIRAVDPDVPVSDVRTLDAVVAESARSRRWTMALLAAFASLAVVLAAIGIYGLMAWLVGQRTREIGIRMALGADAAQVRAMVVQYSLKLGLAGTAIGLVGAFALRSVLASLVFDVSPSDPALYAAVAALLSAVAVAGAYFPSRRASRVDPWLALRWE
jgi:putative ABC transport system permease protein